MTKLPKHRRIPRGKGYDKVSMLRSFRELQQFKGGFLKFCRVKKLNADWFARSAETYFPDSWDAFITEDGAERKECYCGYHFFPNNARQQFCTSKCSRDAKRDAEYFSGNRQSGAGVRESICQLCGRPIEKNLQAHHVYGKMKDLDDTVLVALHSGCHEIVEKLSKVLWGDDPEKLVKLIEFVWKKKHGWDNPDLNIEIELTIEVV